MALRLRFCSCAQLLPVQGRQRVFVLPILDHVLCLLVEGSSVFLNFDGNLKTSAALKQKIMIRTSFLTHAHFCSMASCQTQATTVDHCFSKSLFGAPTSWAHQSSANPRHCTGQHHFPDHLPLVVNVTTNRAYVLVHAMISFQFSSSKLFISAVCIDDRGLFMMPAMGFASLGSIMFRCFPRSVVV